MRRSALFVCAPACVIAAAACDVPPDVPAGGAGMGGGTSSVVTTTGTFLTTTSVTTTTSTGTHTDVPYPAPHPDPPQVVSHGGPVLAAPRIVPVFFPGDDPTLIAQLTDFETKVGATQYWSAVTSEYGVGPATVTAPIQLTEAPPATLQDSDIQTWIAAKLDSDDPAWPAADANTLYVIHYPAGTDISFQGNSGLQQSCVNFGGYHSTSAVDGAHGGIDVAYAVIPRCDSFDGFFGIDALTTVVSHELMEAATDPYALFDPAYSTVDDAHLEWAIGLGGGEIGDMCAQSLDSFTTFDELPYMVQRGWSNAAALAGHDPCVPPLPGSVYFNAAPVLPDKIPVGYLGTKYLVDGVKIPVGGTRTIELDLFSEGDTGGPWEVDVFDWGQWTGQGSNLELSLDNSVGQNGDKLMLTITVDAKGQYGMETFMVQSTSTGRTIMWLGAVGN